MGGHGSGRPERLGSRGTTEACNRIDVRWMRRQGLLAPLHYARLAWKRGDQDAGSIGVVVGADFLELRYSAGEGSRREDVRDRVTLEWTPCPYGGRRAWLRCPCCGRRCAILYAPCVHFLCRTCWGLAYRTQRLAPDDRARVKSENIRERLGGPRGIAWPFPPKPDRMRWRTYERLRAKARASEGVWDVAARKWLAASEDWLQKRLAELDASKAGRAH